MAERVKELTMQARMEGAEFERRLAEAVSVEYLYFIHFL
jgi:hypothetical protein